MSEWLDIASAPRDGSPVLVCFDKPVSASGDAWTWHDADPLRVMIARWWTSDPKICDEEDGWYAPYPEISHGYDGTDYFAIRLSPTHWQPLPEPPNHPID